MCLLDAGDGVVVRPSNVVREGTSDRRACSSVSPAVQAAIESTAVLVEERLELTEAFQERRPRANYRSPAQSGVRGGGPRFNATSAVLSCPAGGGDRDT